jgi:hypothetical protein
LSNARLPRLQTSHSHVSFNAHTIAFASLAFMSHLTDNHSAVFHIITGTLLTAAQISLPAKGMAHHSPTQRITSPLVGNLHSLIAVYIGVSNAQAVIHDAIPHFNPHHARLAAHFIAFHTQSTSPHPIAPTTLDIHLPTLPAVVSLLPIKLEGLACSSNILCSSICWGVRSSLPMAFLILFVIGSVAFVIKSHSADWSVNHAKKFHPSCSNFQKEDLSLLSIPFTAQSFIA